jgi:coatomer epsilon subunit
MSVIFQTLKKLQSSAKAKEQKDGRSRKPFNVYSFRTYLSSTLIIIIICVLTFVSGYLVMDSIRHLKDGREPDTRETVLQGAEQHESPGKKVDTGAEAPEQPAAPVSRQTEVPPPPEPKAMAATEDAIISSTNGNGEIDDPRSKTGAQHSPPVSRREPVRVAAVKKEPDEHAKGAAPVKTAPSPGDAKTQKQTALGPEGRVEQKRQQPKPALAAKTQPTPTLSSQTADGISKPTPEPQTGLHAAKPTYVNLSKQIDGKSSSGPLGPKPSAADRTEQSRKQEIQMKTVDKSMRISRLMEKIQLSLKQSDFEAADKLTEQLAMLKGAENHLVLNIRAYGHILKDEYESAAGLLQKVLDENKENMEAGINMAIVEIRMEKINAARNRLVKLKKVYPDELVITEIIHKLR